MSEVRANSLKNCLRSALAEAFNKPLFGVAVALAKIAGLASWQDIVGRIAALTGYWNEVILMKGQVLIKHRRSMTTIRTSAMPVVETAIPVVNSKSRYQHPFSSATPLFARRVRFGVSLVKTLLRFSEFDAMVAATLLIIFSHLFRVITLPAHNTGDYGLSVIPLCAALYFTGAFWVVNSALASVGLYSLSVIAVVSLFLSRNLIRVSFRPFGVFVENALFTPAKQIVSTVLVSMKVDRIGGEPRLTFCALLQCGRNVQHSASLSLNLKWMSADGEIDRLFGLQSLADTGKYTTLRRRNQE